MVAKIKPIEAKFRTRGESFILRYLGEGCRWRRRICLVLVLSKQTQAEMQFCGLCRARWKMSREPPKLSTPIAKDTAARKEEKWIDPITNRLPYHTNSRRALDRRDFRVNSNESINVPITSHINHHTCRNLLHAGSSAVCVCQPKIRERGEDLFVIFVLLRPQKVDNMCDEAI